MKYAKAALLILGTLGLYIVYHYVTTDRNNVRRWKEWQERSGPNNQR